MAYYKHVEISACFDLDWLVRFVHPEACVFWNGLPFQMHDVEDIKSWYSQWTTSLRISRLTTGQFVTADFVSILPQLQHLEALHYNAMTIGLAVVAAIFEMAHLPRVAQLVELDLNNESSDEVWINATVLSNVIAWLTTSPVRRFRIFNWYWDPDVADDSTLIQAFYSALFNCPTLDTLDINDCELSAAAFEGTTLWMRELMRHNQSLRVLDLRDNNIGLTGAMTLLEHASHVDRLVKVEAIRIVGAVEEETIDDKLIAFWHKTLS
ncbi:unnamed protein product [Aphanomyces euteiches]